jgi:uncharacterized membrane-anchored protein
LSELIPEGMTDAAMWAVIVGFISPVALNVIISALWPSWVKSTVAFGFSLLVGGVTALLTGAYEGLGLVSTVLLTFVVAITTYQNFWRQVAPNMQRHAEEKAHG